MSAFRLETYAPADAGSGLRQPSPRDREIEAVREAAYRAGYLAGQAAASEAILDEQGRLTSDFVEALEDARMTNEAARRHVAASLAPVATAICTALTDVLAASGLAAEVAGRVEHALSTAPDARPRLRCAPELAATLRGILADRRLNAAVEPAPEMLPREVTLHWEQGFDRIDLEVCAEEIRACIERHLGAASEDNVEELRRYG